MHRIRENVRETTGELNDQSFTAKTLSQLKLLSVETQHNSRSDHLAVTGNISYDTKTLDALHLLLKLNKRAGVLVSEVPCNC